MRKLLSIMLIAGQIVTGDAMFASEELTASKLNEISSGEYKIYTAPIKLTTGQMAYFGCEPIVDEDRSHRWRAYERGTSVCLSLQGSVEGYDLPLTFFFPLTQKYQQELTELILNSNTEKMSRAFSGISSGCSGMQCHIGAYISYVCKQPITGFFELPEDSGYSAGNESYNLDGYVDNYNNLLMSVSSYDLNPSQEEAGITYEHRGIFRNPISMLRKDYPGLAILLHSFTGVVWRTKSPKIEKMIVNPNGNFVMRSMLIKHFKGREGVLGEEARITIPVNILGELFKSMQQDNNV